MPKGRRPGRLNELMDFLMGFVAKSEGQNRIKDLMKKNRGASYVPHLIKASQPAHVMFVILNLQAQWKHKLWLKRLTGDELTKYNDKASWTKVEEEKFAAPPRLYTAGESTKKMLGKDLRNKLGRRMMEKLERAWKEGFKDKECRRVIGAAWDEWTIKKQKFWCKERVKSRGEEVRSDNIPRIELSGDAEYMDDDDNDMPGLPELGAEDGGGPAETTGKSPPQKSPPRRARDEGQLPQLSPRRKRTKRKTYTAV